MQFKGSVGALLPNTEGRLVDEDGNNVASGMPGELWLRGPSLMKSVTHFLYMLMTHIYAGDMWETHKPLQKRWLPMVG